jgi:hypothetical protein
MGKRPPLSSAMPSARQLPTLGGRIVDGAAQVYGKKALGLICLADAWLAEIWFDCPNPW